ncbi:MAG: hypothetical protein AAGC46_11605 [Solirubrobacteraceae bacterium]|nr:hypothetical protein [Patulibacter sp.]
MPASTPPVAFSLSAPLGQAVRAARRRPVATLGPVVALLLPLLPLAAGAQFVLENGGSGALQGLIAGAPAGRPGALILRPDTSGWLLLAALVALLTAMIAVIVAAGLTTGAGAAAALVGDRRREERNPRLDLGLGRSLSVWPAMLVALTFQLLVVVVVGAVIVVAAVYAGRIRFQLTSVVELLGLGTLLMWLIRGSLWPATALTEDLPPAAALRRSWEISHGSVLRLLAAALTAALAIGVPALVVRFIVKLVLTALAGQEVIGLSPLAIDLWALVPVPIAIFLISAVWGREAPLLTRAMVEQQHRVLVDGDLDRA